MIKFFLIFKSSITSLTVIFITYYYLSNKKDLIFNAKFIYIFYHFLWLCFVSLILYLGVSNIYCRLLMCFFVFVINFVRLRTQSSLPIFTWEFDHCLDCSLPLLTLLFLHQVASISSLTLFFPTHSLSLFVYSGLWRTSWELLTGWICRSPFDSLFSCPGSLCLLLPPLFWVTAWTSLRGPDCGEHIWNWLLSSLLSPLEPPLLPLANSISLLLILFSI